jgi:hypothetical protein
MSNKYFQIRKDLYLVESEVENKQPNLQESSNHLWVYDRSGSMSGTLDQLIDDLKQKARSLTKGDTLSLAWFSGEGDHRFILKGYKFTGSDDFKDIDKILDKNSGTIGTTCFSEVLEETAKTIEDLSVFGDFSLTWFTDGVPVVSNYNKEVEKIFAILGKLEGKLSSAMLVGYGSYYNKSLMQEMAARLGGSLVHADDIPTFSTQITEFINTSREAGSKIRVTTPYVSKIGAMFSVSGKNVISYQPKDKVVPFVIGKAAKDYLYAVVDKLQGDEEKVDLDNLGPRSSFLKGMYGAACLLSQKAETQLSVDILGHLGDKAIIDLIQDSFTNSEYGRAEKAALEAMAAPSARFAAGKVKGYVKPDDAPCVLDALDKILTDKDAKLFPYAGEGYQRIGAKSTQKSERIFTPNKQEGYAISDITWNSSRLNLSLRTRVSGTVELDERHKKFGLAKDFPCSVIRNFTIVKDGILNMKKPVMSLSKETHEYLSNIGCTQSIFTGGAVTYDLSVLPIMNRKTASVASVVPVCDLAIRETELEGLAKVFKNFAKTIETEVPADTGYGAAVEAYLEENHIKKGIFSPPTEKAEATDWYMGKTFDIKLKGLSSLPKVSVVEEKITAGKKLTTSDTIIEAGLKKYKTVTAGLKDTTAKLKVVDTQLEQVKTELAQVRSQLMRQKFAVTLGKSLFTEFKGQRQEQYTWAHRGFDFTFEMGEEKVEY